MKWKDRRTKHSMKDPVRGEFRKTGQYFPHPGRVPMQVMLTGVVTGPGIPPTPAEHLRNDLSGREFERQVLPALIDRADPTRMVILWDEIPKPDPRQQALQEAAHAAEQMSNTGQPAPDSARPVPKVYVYDSASSQPSPDWARDMIADLSARGVLDMDSQPSPSPYGPITVQTPDEVVDLTAGHLSAADAARLACTGEQATAVLVAINDVAVPRAALPSPTASLCDLTLHITPAGGSSYIARTRVGFRDASRRATVAVIGAVLPVRIDPADPARVAIDVAAFDAQNPSS